MIPLLYRVFSIEQDKGNAFLYHLLELMRQVQEDRIAVARLAYLLVRHTPGGDATHEQRAQYDSFSRQVYQWALEPAQQENHAFQVAILFGL